MIIPTNQLQSCSQCPTYTRYATDVAPGQFEHRCSKHMAPGVVQEYWTVRMLNAAQNGDIEKARELLKLVFSEVRGDARKECIEIAERAEQEANNTYFPDQLARGARAASKDIARAIQTI